MVKGQIIDVKSKNRNNSAIVIFLQPLSKLSENCLLVTGITNLNMIHVKLFKLSLPQSQIIYVKCEKIAINRPIFFFQPLLNLSENWSFVTYITNLGRIHEKLFNLSCPQVNVNADDAELQLQ